MASGPEEARTTGEPFINVSEMELNIATKGRAASMDVRRGREQARPNSKAGKADLPQILGIGAAGLPGISASGGVAG